MKILGLDISTKTGFAVIEDGKLIEFGLLKESKSDIPDLVESFCILDRAQKMASQISKIIKKYNPDKITIEQTNSGKFRFSQKNLEFIHCCVLTEILNLKNDYAKKTAYVDTSRWRKILEIKLSKEQRNHNKNVSLKKAKGKLTWKHLSVAWANRTHNLSLKLKDNDIADAIALAHYTYIQKDEIPKEISIEEILGLK